MRELSCVLEALHSLRLRGLEEAPLSLVAAELGVGEEEARRLVEEARARGWVVEAPGGFKLTDLGVEEVHRHREQVIHDRLAHGAGLKGRLTRLLEGRVRDLDAHWRTSHGLNGSSLEELHQGFMGLQGRVEDLRPITGLPVGARGVVVFALGGRGLTRRLAEMGLTPGAEVRVLRRAPLRGPIEVQVRGVCLALGFGVASRVIVKPLS